MATGFHKAARRGDPPSSPAGGDIFRSWTLQTRSDIEQRERAHGHEGGRRAAQVSLSAILIFCHFPPCAANGDLVSCPRFRATGSCEPAERLNRGTPNHDLPAPSGSMRPRILTTPFGAGFVMQKWKL